MGKNKYIFSSISLKTSCEDCQSLLLHNPYTTIDLYDISANTKKNYRYFVNTLRKMLKYEYPTLTEIQHLELLLDFPLVIAKLDQFFGSQHFMGMHKNLLIFLCKFFGKSKKFHSLHEQYAEVLNQVCDSQTTVRAKNEKNEKEIQNWVSFQEIEQYLETMQENLDSTYTELMKIQQNSKRYAKVEKQYIKNLKESAILACYVLIPPIRNDWPSVKVKNFDETKDNFVQLNNEKVQKLVLNDYKTFKIYGQIKIPITAGLSKILNKYIDCNTPTNSDYLFTPTKNDRYSNSNFSKYLVRIMKRNFPGKNINIQMLRKIYTSSEKFESVQKSKEIAKCMGHSFEQHFLYYKKPSAVDRRKEILFFLNKEENKDDLYFDTIVRKWKFN